MQSKNPVLTRMEEEAKRNGGYAGFGNSPATATTTAPDPAAADWPPPPPVAPAPVATPVVTHPMALADVVAKTTVMGVLVFVFAFGAWQLNVSPGVVIVALLIATGLGFWGALSTKIRPPVYLAYAVAEGVTLGGISLWYANYATDPASNVTDSTIVVQAVIGTFSAFAAMLFLYVTRIIKVGSRFRRMMMIALVGYLFVAIASLIAAMFGVGDGFGFYGSGGLGLLLCIVGVALAAFTLALDFDAIETAINAGLPEQESWRAAFGLIVTLVWLYLEILRFLAILNRS
jgi:uncharacterized YccA/Bax inhibitor family protein